MLSVCRKGDYLSATMLSPAEDQALRLAYGRYATANAREDGARVVQRWQYLGEGHWFACDCLNGRQAKPPVLIPVMESYIRRHTDPAWPAHAEDCDFFREPAEQRLITKSYGPPPSGPLRLVRRFDLAKGAAPQLVVRRSYAWRREGLATMLRLLQIKSGLNRVPSAAARQKLGDQFRMLRSSAGEIEIDDNLPLSRFLCTYAPALPEFTEKVGAAPARQFKQTRPHGIFITVVNGVSDGQLLVSEDLTLPVRGRISIFGERDGQSRERNEEISARAPYLATCLVARPKPSEPVEVIKAYLHPCVSHRDLMLVDSNYERKTLVELRRLQQWLSAKRRVRMEIEKSMLDIGAGELQLDMEKAAREPCIPDFIIRADPAPVGGSPVVVVETMGFESESYRARKLVMHELLRKTLNAPVLTHDFHFPTAKSQTQRDRSFWLGAHWAITGPDKNIAKHLCGLSDGSFGPVPAT